MAKNTTMDLVAGEWVEGTDGDITKISFQNLVNSSILVKGTVGSTQPTDALGAYEYWKSQGESGVDPADLWPGVSGVNRVWFYSEGPGRITISHD